MSTISTSWVSRGAYKYKLVVTYNITDNYSRQVINYMYELRVQMNQTTTTSGTFYVSGYYRSTNGGNSVSFLDHQFTTSISGIAGNTLVVKTYTDSYTIHRQNANIDYTTYFGVNHVNPASSGATTSFEHTVETSDAWPSCTYTVTSSAPYFTQGSTGNNNYSIYRVKVTSVNGGDGSSFHSAALNVGDKVASTTNIDNVLAVSWNNSDISVVGNSVSFSPELTISNTSGKHRTYSLSSITVTNHRPPSFNTYTPTKINTYTPSGGNATLYKDYSGYKVQISGFNLYNNSSSATVKMVIGSQSSNVNTITTSTSSSELTINPLNASGSLTPQITITDNFGASTTSNLSSITVSPSDLPICTISEPSSPSGGYIAGWSGRQYTITINSAEAKNNKIIDSIKLIFDGVQSSSLINNQLSVTPPIARDSIRPQVIITDNLGKSNVYTLTAVSVNPNSAPPAPSYTVVSRTQYAPNNNIPVSIKVPYTINLTSIPTIYNKSISTITVYFAGASSTISNPNTTTNKTITVYPENIGTFKPEIVVTDIAGAVGRYTGTNTVVNARTATTNIASLTRVKASDVNTAAERSDIGTQAVIQATFNYSQYTNNYLLEPTVTIGTGNSPLNATVIWYENWTNNTLANPITWTNYSPSLPKTLYGKITQVGNSTTPFDANNSYIINVTPQTSALTGDKRSGTLAQAFYLLVGKAGGHSLGIGKKPIVYQLTNDSIIIANKKYYTRNGSIYTQITPSSGSNPKELGYYEELEGILDIGMGKIILNNYESNTPTIAYQGANARHDMIKFIDNTNDDYGNGIVIGGGAQTIIGGGESADVMKTQVGVTGAEIMYIGNDTGVNIFTNLQNGWSNRYEFVFKSTDNGDLGLPLATSEALYTAIDNLGWVSAVIS